MSLAPSLGIDIGGTGIKWSLVQGGTVVDSGSLPTPRTSADHVLDAVASVIASRGADVQTVGVALPGLVDTVTRSTVFIPNLPGDWRGLPVAERLESRTKSRVALINDARAFGYAELNAGAGRGHTNVLFVTLGTGVGGALARDGALLVGAIDALGEVGHTIVEPSGALCGCGGRGCLETVASASAIAARVLRPRLMSLSTELAALDPGLVSVADIAAAARAGDRWAADAFARAGRGLGIAAGNVASLLRITTVVVGGGLTPAFDLLAPAAQAALVERDALIGPIAVIPAERGAMAGSIGAALFAADQFHDPALERTSR